MKKLRCKRGFTLTEMLISVMLLGFVSIMVTVMTSAILNSTVMMQEVAQAEILGSEVFDNLQGQLRVAQSLEVDGDGHVTFDRDDANKGYTFALDEDGKILLGKETTEVGEDETTKVVFKGDPLFAGSSYGNLSVTELQFTVNDDNKTIEIFVVISYGKKALWNGSVTVKPLNGIKVV